MTELFDNSGKLKPPTPEELADADADSDIIVLDTGTLEDGSPYWAYIAVKPSKYKAFMRMTTQRNPIAFEDFGTIVKHGFEAHVPLKAQEEMKAEYGFDADYLKSLQARLLNAQTLHIKQQAANRINDIVAMMKKQNK